MSSQHAVAELADFARFVGELRIENGSAMVLYDFQRAPLEDYFGDARETVIILPKKNGKSTLIAALVLYHLIITPNAECVVVAASREQAEIILRQSRMFVRNSDALKRFVSVRQRSILSLTDEGRIRVLASDEDTADGTIPTLAIVDELHRHKTSDLYGVLRDGLGARGGRMITISTAGARFDSPLGLIREAAHGWESFEREGAHNRAWNPASRLAFHEWCLMSDDDVQDMDLVKMANPAPWHTPKTLLERWSSDTMTKGQWLRFACGIWTEGEEPAITEDEWNRLYSDIGQIETGERVIMVPSVGHNAAIAMVAVRPEGRVACKVEILQPQDRTSILERTEKRILELCREYDAEIHAPGVGFIRSRELLADQRLEVVEAPQSVAALAAATGTFNRMLRSGLLMHDGDPVLRSHVLSATLKTNEAGERYEVSDRARGLIALVMAVHGVTEMAEPTPTIHVYRGA